MVNPSGMLINGASVADVVVTVAECVAWVLG